MTATPSPGKKALDYAESLGLNSVYEAALEARRLIESRSAMLVDVRDKKRRNEEERINTEMEISERERAANPDLSMAAFERHLKVVFATDTTLRTIRDNLISLSGIIDQMEHEIDLLNTDIKIAVARLHELGGYFQFMAVIKSTSEAKKSRQDGNPW